MKFYAGWSDEALNLHGRQQAYQLGKILATRGVGIIYTSPLRRAIETAEIIAQITKAPIIKEEGFIEMKMGPWEGKSEEQIAAMFPGEWDLWKRKPAELKLPGRETLDQLLERVLKTLSLIKKRKHSGNIVIVTHYAVIRVIILYVQGKDLNLYKTIIIPNCVPFELEI